MSDVTRILHSIEQGDPKAAEELLPLVYEQLRRLAVSKMASQPPGQTIQGTALVHEAFIKLVESDQMKWHDSRHFFRGAAQAMRQILVDRARRKLRVRHGADFERIDWDQVEIPEPVQPEILLQLDEALVHLEAENPELAQIVNLRFYAGFSEKEIASILDSSERSVQRQWAYARAWLFDRIKE